MLLLVLGMLVAVGLPRSAARWWSAGLVRYGLWLHWFLARHGLGLSRFRAAVLVLGINLGDGAIVIGPRFLTLVTNDAALAGK